MSHESKTRPVYFPRWNMPGPEKLLAAERWDCIVCGACVPVYKKPSSPAGLFHGRGSPKKFDWLTTCRKIGSCFFYILVQILLKLYFPAVSSLVSFLVKLISKLTERSIKSLRDSRDNRAFKYRYTGEREAIIYSRSPL